MPPAILIIEARREVADALEHVMTSARYIAIVRPYLDQLSDVGISPAAIVVRIASEGIGERPHEAIARLPPGRPPVVAIATTEDEMAEAVRLKCEVVLRAPHDVTRLCDVLMRLVQA